MPDRSSGKIESVDRGESERLRDLPGKVIRGDIRFARKRNTSPLVVAEGIEILNPEALNLTLSIHYNPEVGSKTFNVHLAGVGTICRLDVDGRAHRELGRSHKHSLIKERCPARILPHAIDASEFSGQSIREIFETFCQLAMITYEDGEFEAVDKES